MVFRELLFLLLSRAECNLGKCLSCTSVREHYFVLGSLLREEKIALRA